VSMNRANKRLAWFMGVALVVLAALFAKAFYVQVVDASALQDKGSDQHLRSIELDAPRGVIYDRNGQELAVSQSMATVYANPTQIKDVPATASALAPILRTTPAELEAKLRSESGFKYLARKVDLQIGERVKELGLEGIGVCVEDKRIYPKGKLAPQLLGYVGTDNLGLAGLEKQYEAMLAGEPGKLEVVSDRSGNRLSTVSLKEAVEGEPLNLTIDEEIQFETERILTETVETFQAQKACAIVIDPQTGEILAMANTPVFDTNDYGSVEEMCRRNSVITDQYEPGSTFKMVVTAAALEAGLVSPETTFILGDTIQVYDRVVHEAHENLPDKRELTVTQILAQSSNVGAITLGLEVGKTRLVDMIRKFGFTEKLRVDFPGEADGQMLAPEKWSGTTIANVPMGQGIAATPLQLATAYAAIANDGILVQPHLVKDATTPWTRRVVSPTVAAQLREMLTVTVEDGTGTQAQIEGYAVAGKTGTAEKVKADGSGYDEDRVIASFVGMVPADDPQLIILVMIDEPSTEHSGAYVAAPAFARIADFALKRLGIPPTSAD